ncbi:MAG: hypothetical protein B7Z47_07365, partial [Chthoniobacter sp. 12-60-6]
MLKHLLLLCLLTVAAQAQDLGPAKDDPSVPKDRDTILRIQIFLDKNLFGPGKLDGAVGEFTYKAVVNYNYAHGKRDLYNWSHIQHAAEAEVPIVFAAFKVQPVLTKYVTAELPEDYEQASVYPFMAYRSMLELIAERFHTDESFLAAINPKRDLAALRPGDIIVVPNVKSFRIEEIKPMQSFKTDTMLSSHTIVVDTTERMAAIYSEKEMMLAAFPITPGKP